MMFESGFKVFRKDETITISQTAVKFDWKYFFKRFNKLRRREFLIIKGAETERGEPWHGAFLHLRWGLPFNFITNFSKKSNFYEALSKFDLTLTWRYNTKQE